MICVLCGQDIMPRQAFSRCSEEIYSAQEMELMGLGDHGAYACDAASHIDCIEAFSAPRGCCAPVSCKAEFGPAEKRREYSDAGTGCREDHLL
jgi:hypothetical protein